MSVDTAGLESGRGEWNSWCSGGMRRYQEEHQRRRQLAGTVLTLRRESVGSEQDEHLSCPLRPQGRRLNPAISAKALVLVRSNDYRRSDGKRGGNAEGSSG